ncbi:T4 RnlA family RNA ligase [Patescibacteria group bacterium]|nr:T4 RnlA family RNA ligase [Patescibacteria group bacterium]
MTDREDFSFWLDDQDGEEILAEHLDYVRKRSMPTAASLVKPFFHPSLPLIGWNYSQVAHNTLYRFPEGWTDPLRQCRGLVMDHRGNLVAKPFTKFFNQGEHPETRNLPDEPFLAMEKHDGHLGIVFRYEGQLHVTTRGTFTYKTAKIARSMIAKSSARARWNKHVPEGLTVLVEIIHAETHVIRRYDEPGLVLIGAFDNASLREYGYADLLALGQQLNLPVASVVTFGSLAEIGHHMTENVENREGFVLWYERSGLRVKFKYQTYIGRMVADKLSYPYIIRRILDGSWTEKMDMLPEEILPAARDMVAKLKGARRRGAEAVYLLETEERRTSTYRKLCRDFVSARKTA